MALHSTSSTQKHTPPLGVQRACRRGLELYEAGKGGKGLVDHTLVCARHMAAGKKNTTEQIHRMAQWFARHQTDKKPQWHRPPTPGYVAWQLWGGDAGMRWSQSVMRRLKKTDEK